jgi:hypothetical protein
MKASSGGIMMTSNEVVSFTGDQEESLRVFFGRFLIVHLAQGSNMDGYLGFTPPEALALSNRYP